MKHVYDSRHVCHLWATLGAQSDARNSSRNVFYRTSNDGIRVLYSYRESYPIASTFSMGEGKAYKQIFLLHAGRAYSVTTAKHISFANRAAKGDYQFTVPFFVAPLDADAHAANLQHYREEIQNACDRLDNTRHADNIQWRLNALDRIRNEAHTYAETFGLYLGITPQPKKNFNPEKLEEMRRHAEELEQGREARAAVRNAKVIAQWRAGQSVSLPRGRYGRGSYWRFNSFALLRIVGEEVQTSMGARVPICGHAGAARLFRLLRLIKESGETYQRNGHTMHVGQFSVDSFDGEVLCAGCHRIQWTEIQAIGEHVLRQEYNLNLAKEAVAQQ